MLNLLEDYIWRSVPEWGEFATSPNLPKKVAENGAFLPFYGNTVVFDLDDDTKTALESLREELYAAAGWMLAQRLDTATFHMTLHDLVNASALSDGLTEKMAQAEAKAKPLVTQWREQPPLRMKTTHLFNMMNTSVVLGLAPADEESYRRLSEMYAALETVVPLGYALTPHITMAYYTPGRCDASHLWPLRQALRPVELEITLDMERLMLQTFTDMNHYYEI